MIRRFVTGTALTAFVALGVLAALPHTHAHRPAASHYCTMCQAHTAPPHVAPPVAPAPVLQRCAEVIALPALALVPQGLVVLPASRAPPAVA